MLDKFVFQCFVSTDQFLQESIVMCVYNQGSQLRIKQSVDSSLKTTNRSFRYATPHFWNKLPPTLSVAYQFDPSSSLSSSPSSYSDPGPPADLSRGVFCSRLNPLKCSGIRWLHLKLFTAIHV